MPIQYINTGSGANAGNGDSLRSAFIKVNNNFTEIISVVNNGNGYTGSRGAGYTGSRGSQGPMSPQGYTGSQGIIGFTGSTGTQGIIGFTGSRGAYDAIGFTGSTGTQGEIGFTGSTGTQGVIGFTGSASTATGFTGSTGTQGIIGFTGSTGYTGSTGTQGIIGFTGSASTATGFTGSTGTQGPVGGQGIQGFTGSTGTQGIIGFTGSASTASQYIGSSLTLAVTSSLNSTGTTNGAAVITGGIGIGGDIQLGGTMYVGGNILPSTDIIQNIGSLTKRWRSLYVSSSTIYIGDYGLGIQGGQIVVSQVGSSSTTGTFVFDLQNVVSDINPKIGYTGSLAGQNIGSTTATWKNLYVGTVYASNLSVTGAINVSAQKNFVRFHWDTLTELNSEANPSTWHGMLAHVHATGRVYVAHSAAWVPLALQSDIVSSTGIVTVSNTATTATTGTQWYNTVEGRTYVATGGVWINANPTEIPSPETYLEGLAIDGTTISTANIDSNAIVIDGGNNTKLTISNNDVTIQTHTTSTTSTWTFSSTGTLTFPDVTTQTGASISITDLKTLVAASTDFANFKSRIAGL